MADNYILQDTYFAQTYWPVAPPYWASGLTFEFETPACRTFIIMAEQRSLAVSGESRVTAIPSENRTLVIKQCGDGGVV